MSRKTDEPVVPEDIRMLDELTKKVFDELKAAEKGNYKIGDFIKMIETRRKLIPVGDEQKKFWSMLEEIRKDSLEKNKDRKVRKRKTAKE